MAALSGGRSSLSPPISIIGDWTKPEKLASLVYREQETFEIKPVVVDENKNATYSYRTYEYGEVNLLRSVSVQIEKKKLLHPLLCTSTDSQSV